MLHEQIMTPLMFLESYDRLAPLTDEQWWSIQARLPEHAAGPQGGRPRLDDRHCFEGLLWILWTGAAWNQLPARFGSGTTCWRRFQEWQAQGVVLEAWRAYIAQLDGLGRRHWLGRLAERKLSGHGMALRRRSGWLRLVAQQFHRELENQAAAESSP